MGAPDDPSDDSSVGYSQDDRSDTGSEFSEPYGYDEGSHDEY